MTDLGSHRSSNFREMAGHIYTIMTVVGHRVSVEQGTKVPVWARESRSCSSGTSSDVG